jgi:hypothetical protein
METMYTLKFLYNQKKKNQMETMSILKFLNKHLKHVSYQ